MSPSGRRVAGGLTALAAATAFVLLTAGPPPPVPDPPGTFSFAVLGDAPYYAWEEAQFNVVLADMDHTDLRFILHVGDIFWAPCSDDHYRKLLGTMNARRHPLIYTPGDNEWSDCWGRNEGRYRPLERLDTLREIFFGDPERSLGPDPIPLDTQGNDAEFGDFVENARWTQDGVVLATLHMAGSRNAGEKFPGRTEADDLAARRRTEAAIAWMRETFAAADTQDARAVVLAFHMNPGFAAPVTDPYRMAYDPFILALEELAEAFGKPVLMVHGDDHEYVVDRPLARRTTGRTIENLTRMQVPGSPQVGWVRVFVTDAAVPEFSFREYVVPGWKYW